MTDLNKGISVFAGWGAWKNPAVLLSTSSPLASESQALQEPSSYVLRLSGTAACPTLTWPL